MAFSRRPSPRASVQLGRLAIVFLDLWTNLYGLDFELRIGRRIYWLAFGFGKGVQRGRGVA